MTIISTTVGRNPLKKWSSHHSQQRSTNCSTSMKSQEGQNDLWPFPRQVMQYHSHSSNAPTSNVKESEVEWFYEDLQYLWELTPPKNVLFIIGDWNEKVGSQETPGVTGKFGLGVMNEAGQKRIESWQESTVVTLFQQHKRRLYTWTLPCVDVNEWSLMMMVNTKIRLIIFFAAKYGKALHIQRKQDQELTVAQIMNSLSQNSD